MRCIKRLARSGVVALAAALAAAVASPVSADAFPVGTFQIVDSHGTCAFANIASHAVGPVACAPLNAFEQWTWDPADQLLFNIGSGQCAWAPSGIGTNYAIGLSACDPNDPHQQWQRYTYVFPYTYRIQPASMTREGGWFYYAANRFYNLDYTYGAPNRNLTFTMPPL